MISLPRRLLFASATAVAIPVLVLVYVLYGSHDDTYLIFLAAACPLALFCSRILKAASLASKLTVGFLIAAFAHLVFSYASASLFLSGIPYIPTNIDLYFSQAALIVAVGIISMAVGANTHRRASKRLLHLSTSLAQSAPRSIAWRASAILAIGVLMVAFVYSRIGFLPLLTDDPDRVRYFGGDISGSYLFEYSVFRRALVILGVIVPIFWPLWTQRRNKLALPCFSIGALLLGLSGQRIRLIVPILTIFVLYYASNHLRPLHIAGFAAFFVVFTAATQIWFQSRYTEQFTELQAIQSVFAEVPAFGWLLANDPPFYNGATFIAAVIPLPKETVPFKQEYGLTNITKRLVGFENNEAFAGLRITAFGEMYLNFGYVGVVLMGFLFGRCLGSLSWTIEGVARATPGAMLTLYPLVFLWTYISATLYMAGSMGILDGIGALAIMVIVYLPSLSTLRKRMPIDSALQRNGTQMCRSG